jgi:CheY-like chemotaxis protein/HPt (histidine-containing phosphotransfer) domain-containing protein
LISDILDLSKIEAGKLELEIADFNLTEVIHNVVNQVSVKSQEKGLVLTVTIEENVPLRLKGDSLRLGQILLNLVSNAVKFTEKGSVLVLVRLLNVNEETALIHFSVQDTGIGLTQKQIDILFQPFTQADSSTTNKYGGTGLGLSIAHKLVGMMTGEIGVESKIGIGSTFFFTAKIDIAEKERFIDFDNLFQNWGRKVLLVDDEAESRLIIGSMLSDMSLDVTMCPSGEEAVALMEKAKDNNPYGLVLMDWKMPKMNGIEASRRIKRMYPPSKCPAIVIITAYNSEEVQRKATEIGLDAVLLKPITSSLMLNTIMQIISKDDFYHHDADIKKTRELSNPQHLKGIRVLLVEDNEINQEVAKEILKQAGMVVTIANNGQEALTQVKESVFDIVLMDIQMPVMDGYDATRLIRKNPAFASLPIISMTANALLRDQQKCLQAGMNDNVSKPIDTNQLFQKIAQWVDKDRMLQINQADLTRLASDNRSKAKLVLKASDLHHLESFDFVTSLDRLGGNQEFYYHLLEMFHNNHSDEISSIRQMIVEKDLKSARIMAHTLKSAASNIGAQDVSEAAGLLEYEIGEGRLGNVDNLLKQLGKTLEEAMHSIALFVENVASSEAVAISETDIQTLSPLFTLLAKSLAENDMMANQYLDKILSAVKNSPISDEIAEINGFVEQYDYASALRILENLVNSLKKEGNYGK